MTMVLEKKQGVDNEKWVDYEKGADNEEEVRTQGSQVTIRGTSFKTLQGSFPKPPSHAFTT
jgi:hypothetical protein